MFSRFFVFWIIILIVILIPSFLYTFSSVSFNMGNFLSSKKISQNIYDILKDDKNSLHIWNFHYKMWNYINALDIYSNFNCETNSECIVFHHNLWNFYYKLHYNFDDVEQKIDILTNSLYSYLVSLNIKESHKTRHNYEYVLEKLLELLEENGYDLDDFFDNQDANSPWDESSNEWDSDNQSDQEDLWEEDSNQKWQERDFSELWEEEDLWDDSNQEAQQRQPSMWLWWEYSEALVPLTWEELEFLNNYIENLQREENDNRRLNTPSRRDSIFRWIDLDEFFNNTSDW